MAAILAAERAGLGAEEALLTLAGFGVDIKASPFERLVRSYFA